MRVGVRGAGCPRVKPVAERSARRGVWRVSVARGWVSEAAGCAGVVGWCCPGVSETR